MAKLFVVSGPSGVGKTSVVAQALARVGKELNISRVVTYTTRPPRQGEVNGKDYNFISGDEFKKRIESGYFLEHTTFYGHHSGSPWPSQQDLDLGKSLILIVDLAGAKNVAKLFRDAVFIWIEPPDLTTLETRIKKRGSESNSEVAKRISLAQTEMKERGKLFEYVLVNDKFETAVNEFVMLLKKGLEK